MSIGDKRRIIERFKAGESVAEICAAMDDLVPKRSTCPSGKPRAECPVIHDILRDFLNHKFKLKPKRQS